MHLSVLKSVPNALFSFSGDTWRRLSDHFYSIRIQHVLYPWVRGGTVIQATGRVEFEDLKIRNQSKVGHSIQRVCTIPEINVIDLEGRVPVQCHWLWNFMV